MPVFSSKWSPLDWMSKYIRERRWEEPAPHVALDTAYWDKEYRRLGELISERCFQAVLRLIEKEKSSGQRVQVGVKYAGTNQYSVAESYARLNAAFNRELDAADRRSRMKEQPVPHGRGPEVAPLVIVDIQERVKKGIETYGEPLRSHNGRSATRDAYEECLDLALYLKQKLMEETAETGERAPSAGDSATRDQKRAQTLAEICGTHPVRTLPRRYSHLSAMRGLAPDFWAVVNRIEALLNKEGDTLSTYPSDEWMRRMGAMPPLKDKWQPEKIYSAYGLGVHACDCDRRYAEVHYWAKKHAPGFSACEIERGWTDAYTEKEKRRILAVESAKKAAADFNRRCADYRAVWASLGMSPVSTPPREQESILHEAHRLVHSDRGKQYGHPLEDFSRAGAIATQIIKHKLKDGECIDAADWAMFLVGGKLSREVNKPKRDNRVDGAGYFETLDMVRARMDEIAKVSTVPKPGDDRK